MPNLFNYIDQVKDESFYEQAPNKIDFLVLTELGYLPFNDLLSSHFDLADSLRLADLAEAYFQSKGDKPLSAIANKDRINLLKKASQAKRFKHIKALAFVDDYSRDLQKQFSAMVFRLMTDTFLLAFRGTDDSLIGWKEDFHMTYMKEIPSQLAAKTYLKQALNQLEGQFHLAGHSKGGNLALFAASQLDPDLQGRLTSLTTYDAPGLHRDLVASKGYQTIKGRLEAIIPQDSVVGLLLESPANAKIIKSRAPGLLQHVTFTWEIKDRAFVPADKLSTRSLQTDQTLTSWSNELSDQDLKDFFDIFFGLFLDMGIERLGDLNQDSPKKIQNLLRTIQDLPQDQRDLLYRLTKRLFDTYFQVIKEGFTLPDWSQIDDIFKKRTGQN